MFKNMPLSEILLKTGLTKCELSILKKLSTPIKIQNFLDTLAFNLEEKKESYLSPREVLIQKKAHCLEGALLAALALWLHGEKPLLLDLKAPDEIDHVVTLYRKNGYWGAISKTNHSVLRFRDPVYKTIRELVLSYFHEYFDKHGDKVLHLYGGPLDLSKLKVKSSGKDKESKKSRGPRFDWITSIEDLEWIVDELEDLKHFEIFPKQNMKFLRKADHMERKAGDFTEWKKGSKKT